MAKLFKLLPVQDHADPDTFYAGVTDIFAEYPADVVLKAIDAAKGIPSRSDRPSLRLIKAVCEEYYAPIAREEADARDRDRKATIEPPRPPRTPEQQARVDEQVAAWRREAGVPEEGFTRRGNIVPRGLRADGPGSLADHLKAVAADIEGRRARNRELYADDRALPPDEKKA